MSSASSAAVSGPWRKSDSLRSLCVGLSAWTLAWLTAACGSSSISVDAPSGAKCQVTPSTSISSAPASGASGTISITTTRDCTWAVTNSASWIALTSTDHGQGSGSVSYRVSANADPAPRSATIVVNDTQVRIAQDPAPCRFTVNVPNATVSAAGGSLTATIDASAATCGWTAASGADWVTIASPPSGTGSGTVSLAVRPNAGGARSATVVIAGQTLTISQPDIACAYAISPASQSTGAGGGTVTVAVSAGATCAWAAQPDVPWINVSAGSGAGNGNVTVTVAANPGAARTGTVTIAGKALTVTQAGAACAYTVAPVSQPIAATGGTGTVTVTAASGCPWTAAASVAWITVVAGSSGSGNGSVTFSVAANGGPARTGTITIGGQPFTVTQAAAVACTFAIAPVSTSLPSTGGGGPVAVTAGATCAWVAFSNVAWLTVTAGTSGMGNGTVSFTATGNTTGSARTGTLTIAGQTFTVTQAAACSYAVTPRLIPVPAAGGTGTITVQTVAACPWTAMADVPWISVTTGASGTGNATVRISVSRNGTTSPRTGTVTVAGVAVSVVQPGG